MSENATTSIDKMKYNDLKALAAEKGLDSTGTKEDLIARLTDAGVSGNTDTPSEESNDGDKDSNVGDHQETPQVSSKPVLSETQERTEQTKADRALREDARKMKEALAKQPKVSIMIPFEAGENPENGKKVPFHVNLNGYAMDIPRGVYVEVPKQIAEVIKERLESEGKIGRDWRIDTDARKMSALA